MNATKTTVQVIRYHDSKKVGEAEISTDDLRLYEAQRHPLYQWPEGIAEAQDAIGLAECKRLDIDPRLTVWLE